MTSPAPTTRYRQLDDALIVSTITSLRDRIEERFPASGLGRVSRELLGLAEESAAIVGYLQRPHWPIRIAVGIAIAAVLALLIAAAMTVRLPAGVEGLADVVQVAESAINDLVFLGIAIFFLFNAEGRMKRRRALDALHELRSVVHIVDMHQLTKDPAQITGASPGSAGPRQMSPADLARYLDYCSDLLSLTSKVAALFVQHFNDPVVLAAVNEIEALATGYASRIWQKITLLEPGVAPAGSGSRVRQESRP